MLYTFYCFLLKVNISFIDEIKKFFQDNFPNHPKLAAVGTILVIIAVVLYVVLKELPALSDGLKLVKDFLFPKKKDLEKEKDNSTEALKTEPDIVNTKQWTITNPSNEYVENLNNVKDLIKHIRDENIRIITVKGTAGIGKTKLVEYVCTEKLLEEFPTQVYIDFESINSPIDVGDKTMTTEKIFESAKQKVNISILGGADQEKSYHLVAKDFQAPTILFFDNYEQILTNKDLHHLILNDIINVFRDQNPLIKIIITSREDIEGSDISFEVSELTNTTPDKVKDFKGDLTEAYTAVKLFCKLHNQYLKRKGKIKDKKEFSVEEFEIIVDLCNTVSCLPLGIHLIATSSADKYVELVDIKKNLDYYLKKPIPNTFGEFKKRHANLYRVFEWTFDSLSESEKEFYKHLTFFPNGFFINNMPIWPEFKTASRTRDVISKFYQKSLLREQEYKGASQYRYEVFILFKELLTVENENFNESLSKDYILSICEGYKSMLKEYDRLFNEAHEKNYNYEEVKSEIRLEIENIIHFIKEIKDTHIDIATDMLIYLERILNEVGPYIILEELYQPLLLQTTNQTQKARLLMSKARVVKSTQNREKSLEPIKEAISILKKEGNYTIVLGEAYRIGCYLSGQLSAYDLAEGIFDDVERMSEKERAQLGSLNLAFIILEQAKTYERNGQMRDGIESLNKAISLMEGYKVLQGKALNFAGMFYWRYGYSDDAEKCFLQAIDNYNGLGEDRWILGFHTNLSLMYCDQDRIELGIESAKKASKLLKLQGPYGWSQVNKLSLGRLYSRQDNNDSNFKKAEALLKESYEELDNIGYKESVVLALVELAELYYKYNEHQKSSDYANLCISIAKEYKYDRYMRYFRAICLKGLLAYNDGDQESSFQYLTEAEDLLIQVEKNQWLTYKITRIRYNKLKNLHMVSLIPYPWDNFLKIKKQFNIFGYGSLINQYSSKKAINNSTELIPVMGYGIKRILNYDPDENVRSRAIYQDPDRGDEYFGVFNLEYTGNITDVANGVMRVVNQEDFENFVKREVGYSLVQIRCKAFNKPSSKFIEAYTLVAPNEYNGRQLVNNNLLPNVPYYKVCRDGAEHVSKKFLEVWLETSFLGDGRNVKDWEKEEGLEF